MDATRKRRRKDRARQAWYAYRRQWRFARFLGFASAEPALVLCPASQPGIAACWHLELLSGECITAPLQAV
jgi:hypothetical protein